jgi:hypothetical protein
MKSFFDWASPSYVARRAGFLVALQGMVLLFFIVGTHGWFGRVPANTVDYASFYAAGTLADAGRPEDAYDDAALQTAEERATQPGINHEYFFNPPPFLLIMAPFARLPYLPSFYLFEILTLWAWIVLGTRVAGGGSTATLALMAVPSVWWVLAEGQNSFLSAALMAAGMLALPMRPLLAGVSFGVLCYKPHLGLMVPVALLFGRQWRAMAGAAFSVIVVVAVTLTVYRCATWVAFLAMARRSVGGAIDSGRVLLAGRVDPTGAAQLVGLSAGEARLVWLAALAAAAACVAFLWRRGGRETQCAGLAASVSIAAPFMLYYDLVMASLAAAWLVRAGRRDGFLVGEKPVFGLLLFADLMAAHPVVAALHVPFGALAGPALLALAMRRACSNERGGATFPRQSLPNKQNDVT